MCVQHRPLTAAGEEEEEKRLSPGDRPTLYGVEIGTHARRGGAREERRSIASSPSSSSLGAWAGLAYERSSFGIESGRINEKVALFRVPSSFSFPPLFPHVRTRRGRFVCRGRRHRGSRRERRGHFLHVFVCASVLLRPFRSMEHEIRRRGGRSPFSLIPRFARGPINVDCRCS